MDGLAVIVPVRDNETVLEAALASVERSLAYFRGSDAAHRGVAAEVVVVDDGSRDGTARVAEQFARGRSHLRVLRSPVPGGAADARNRGAAATRGELLFFLDGDDLFYEDHVDRCVRALRRPDADYVKTGVALSDPVHPGWRPRIRNSLVLNLCVRRRCHELVGGFPDHRLTRGRGDGAEVVLDVFDRIEDVFYNRLLGRLFRGVDVAAETVRYIRYPGNSFDRQYEKFRAPPGSLPGDPDLDRRGQIDLAEAVYTLVAARAEAALAAGRAGRAT